MSTEASSGRPNLRQALEVAGRYFTSIVEIRVLKTFIDHKVFDLLPQSGESVSITTLSGQISGADAGRLKRFSAFLVASEILSSPKAGLIAHTERSRPFCTGQVPMGFVVHVYNFLLRPVACWANFFTQHGLAEPLKSNVNPLGMATGHVNLDLYGILDAEPALAKLSNAVKAGSASIYSLKGVYGFGWVEEIIKRDSTPSPPVIVDVGGGTGGGGLRDIITDNPFIPPARCVVLDLPRVFESNSETQNSTNAESFQFVGGSIFNPLPESLRGALVFHARRFFNDFPDDEVVLAMKMIREVCSQETRLLIIEGLLHENRSKFSVAQDLFVMSFGGKRRSVDMFAELGEQAGWKIGAVKERKETDFGIIELVPV